MKMEKQSFLDFLNTSYNMGLYNKVSSLPMHSPMNQFWMPLDDTGEMAGSWEAGRANQEIFGISIFNI